MSTPVSGTSAGAHAGTAPPPAGLAAKLAVAWAFVGVPLAYGVIQTVRKAIPLFTG